MCIRDRVRHRQELLRTSIRRLGGINLSWSDPGSSFLEAVFARGDRRLSPLPVSYTHLDVYKRQTAVRMALAFPDIYEVGMSNLGLKIIYEIVNRHPEMLLERVFAPATDMEDLMRQNNLPLFTLESWQPVREFDFVGFTLQYELSYSNVLNMLDLAGISFYSEERSLSLIHI